MATQKPDTKSGDGAPLVINGGIGGVAITGGAGGSHGNGGAVHLKAGDGGDVIGTNEYPGGPTWVDREYDPNFAKEEAAAKISRFSAVWSWVKDKVLGALIVGLLLLAAGALIKAFL